MKARQKSTAELFREAAIRRGWRPIIIDGQPVKPAPAKRSPKNGDNGSKK